MKKNISNSIKRIQGSGIRKFFDLIDKMIDPINLSIGEPNFGFIPEVGEAIKLGVDNNNCRYTNSWGLPKLRQAISDKYSKKYGKEIGDQNVLITAGASGALDLLFRAILDPADEIIVFDPYFIMYEKLPVLLGAKPVIIKTDDNFFPDLSKLREVVTGKTKAIVINSPNNPTGVVYPKNIIEELVKFAKENDLILISDEVYEDFVYDVIPLSPYSIYEKTIVINSFSKNLALTGQRIGFAIGSEEIICEMAKLQQYTYVCATHLAQVAALENINLDISKYVSSYKQKRDLIFDSLKDDFEIIKPEGAFYIYPKVNNAEKFVEQCIKKCLIVLPGNIFSADNDHIRISYAASDEEIKKGIEILKDVASRHSELVSESKKRC